MPFWLLIPAMGAGQGEQGGSEWIGLAAFRATRLAEAARGWQYICQIIDQDTSNQPQNDANNKGKRTGIVDRLQVD